MSRRPDRSGRPARQARARPLNLEPLEGRVLLASYPVTNTNDGGDGSLRAAIAYADTIVGGTTISFDIPGNGAHTIALQSPLPTITRTVVIDGQTQPGYANGVPVVAIDGSGAGAGASGLTVAVGGSFIRGLSIVGFSANASNTGGEGIYLTAAAGSTQVLDDYLGVEPDGATAKPNANGILAFSANNTIGGPTAATRDVISGNSGSGVLLAGASATGNVVAGDYIGVNAAGTGTAGNQNGVLVMAPGNTIGGTLPGLGNVISGNVGINGNTGTGILFQGQAAGNLVAGNEIGTNPAGNAALFPDFTGITYSNVYGISFGYAGDTGDNLAQETIGGSVAGAGNLISGNFLGITGNVTASAIAGNIIGLDLAGTAPVPNGGGILLGATMTTIGGLTPAARNIISGNNTAAGGGATDGAGLNLSGNSASDLIEGNFVGTAANGLAAPGTGNAIGMELTLTNSTIGSTALGDSNLVSGNLGNGIVLSGDIDSLVGNVVGLDLQGKPDGNLGNGVLVQAPTSSSTATGPLALSISIGGTTLGQGNVIANSGGFGVDVTATAPVGVTGVGIRGNAIYGNALLGINTTSQQSTTPVPSTLFLNGSRVANGLVTLTGVYFDAPGTTVSIDLFANGADASGSGQGRVYLGTVSATTGGSGFAVFAPSFPVSASTPYTSFSATSTPPSGDTSEFAANIPAASTAPQADLVVRATASSNAIIVGDSVTLAETVTNFGPNAASNVVLYDSLPTSLVNAGTVLASQGTGALGGNNVLAASLGTLAAGASATVAVTLTASTAGLLTDTPAASSTTYDPNYLDNTGQQSINVARGSTAPTADLAILESASPSPALVGSPVTYVLYVGNLGPGTATDATVRDFLPAGATLVGVNPSQGNAPSVNGPVVTDDLGTIAPGSVAILTIVATPTAAGSITNAANVSGGQFDPVQSNNATSLTTPVSSATPVIHLALAETPFPAAGAVGQFQAFTLTVTNAGPNTATNVVLVDNLPTNAAYYASTPSQGGAAAVSGGRLIENFGTLPAGGVAAIQVIVIPTAVGAATSFAGVSTLDVPSAAPAFASSTVPIVAGPSVAAVAGVGNNSQIALAFDEALDPTSATNPANYQLVALGKSGTGTAKAVAIASITYNQVAHTVMILPAQAIDPTQYYRITVVGSTAGGVVDTLGRKLAASLYGPAGSNGSATFLAGSLIQF